MMKFDIKGAWKYRDLLEEHQKLKERIVKDVLESRDRAERDYQKKIAHLEDELETASKSYDALEDYCKQMERDLEKRDAELAEMKKELEKLHVNEKGLTAARAEIKRLKKVRYRWVDSAHGWWPVEGANLDDMVQKIPYVVYTPKMEEKRVPEA